MVADGKGNVEAGQGLVSIYDLGQLGGNRFARMMRGSWNALVAIRRIQPVIVHFHDPELIPLGILLKGIGYQVIYDVHEDVPRQILSKYYIPKMFRRPAAFVMALLEWFCARIWTAIVPATPNIAATPVIPARFPPAKTVVVNNFPMLSELALPNSTPYDRRALSFAYIGGIETIRGAIEMVRALEFLNDIDDVSLELAGGFSPAGLGYALRNLPGWDAVNYHGIVGRRQVAQILNCVRAGLVVLHPEPTHIDSYPIKMFEYMSTGIPVIASDFPVWRRIIDESGCGILVDPLNPENIAEAMRWIVNHPAEAESMGRRGRQATERTYNWNTEATKLLDLYDKVLAP